MFLKWVGNRDYDNLRLSLTFFIVRFSTFRDFLLYLIFYKHVFIYPFLIIFYFCCRNSVKCRQVFKPERVSKLSTKFSYFLHWC